MAQLIIKLSRPDGEWYLLYSTESDGVSYGMSLEELTEYIGHWSGADGLAELPARLERVERTGTSALDGGDAESELMCNRAGPGETRLTVDGIVEWYCRRRRDPVAGEVAEEHYWPDDEEYEP